MSSRLASALLLSLLAPAAIHAQGPSALRADTGSAVATFDSVWSRVRHTYYDPAMRGLDWDSVGRALRPAAARAASPRELRTTLTSMLAALGDSHFEIIPGEAAHALESPESKSESSSSAPGETGMTLRLVEGKLAVSRLAHGSVAEAAGVRSGWAIERIGAWDVDGALRAVLALPQGAARRAASIQLVMHANGVLNGAAGDTLTVSGHDVRGEAVQATVRRQPAAGEITRFGNLPPLLVRFNAERRATTTGCVGVISFNIWLMPIAARFDSAMRALDKCDGIVLDLRGNPGGVAGLSMGLAGYFVDSESTLGVMKMRGGELKFAVTPRGAYANGDVAKPYHGRVALVVDPLSASTSEIFAAGMQQLGRMRIFGEPTAGMALPSWLTRLPNGDVLLHAIADYTLPNGQRVEGAGVTPDESVPLARAALGANRDDQLERAVRWVGSR